MLDLTPDNFGIVVNDSAKNVAVLFYAPWCGHCQAFKPTWEALAEQHPHTGELVIARIDASTYKDVRNANGVRGYPTVKLYTKTNKEGIHYRGPRTVEGLNQFFTTNAE